MRKFLFILLLSLTCLIGHAEIINFRAQAYSQREYTYGGWSNWSRWYDTNILITVNTNSNTVVIHSATPQKYWIVEYSNEYYENGARCEDLRFYDQDGDRGTMTLCIKPSGQSEIYIRFANIQWAYVVSRL